MSGGSFLSHLEFVVKSSKWLYSRLRSISWEELADTLKEIRDESAVAYNMAESAINAARSDGYNTGYDDAVDDALHVLSRLVEEVREDAISAETALELAMNRIADLKR